MAEINERASSSLDCPPTPAPPMVSDEMRRLSAEMHNKVSMYIQGQIEGTIDDYKLLEDMNKTSAQRYADMKQVTKRVSEKINELNKKAEDIRPYLEQIDEIDQATKRLEEATAVLDNYVLGLETRFRSLQQ
uniref:Biogenesis of lysosome-related organelles complex 1 subunit 2 n=1 Tax=Steinernema glaseri TaxID=37863 RepID=A0A1I7YMI1_9BILA